VIQIFHNGQPSHGGDQNIFEVMASIQIKDTKETDMSALYLELHLEIDIAGRLRTKLYNKREDFNFPIVNFPFICSNIPGRYVNNYVS
jgi:hypothetical protein